MKFLKYINLSSESSISEIRAMNIGVVKDNEDNNLKEKIKNINNGKNVLKTLEKLNNFLYKYYKGELKFGLCNEINLKKIEELKLKNQQTKNLKLKCLNANEVLNKFKEEIEKVKSI
jgi:hypothetical protein